MKIAIIQFPGSNCETESLRAIRQAGMNAEEFLWNRSLADLLTFDGYFIVGGFSYEDRSRSGIIAALDPLIPYLRAEAEKGKPVLGICNGAQILVETGLVPGLKNYQVGMALATNKRIKNGKILGTGYYNAWVCMQLSAPNTASAFTRHLQPGAPLRVPIAHGEGRFVIPNELLAEMKTKNLTAFRYCDENGNVSEEFPVNPNGAAYNLAAVTNLSGNVMAMMPHPERTDAGQPIFTSMREYISEHQTVILSGTKNLPFIQNGRSFANAQDDKLKYSPPELKLTNYPAPSNAIELPVELIITDNEAVTVQNTLKHLGADVEIKRAVHWEVELKPEAHPDEARKKLIASGILFNNNKEKLIIPEPNDSSAYLLVRYKDDFEGQYKLEQLVIPEVNSVKKGALWKVSGSRATIQQSVEKILATHILFNQFSQECFIYKAPMPYEETIKSNLKNCLTSTNLEIGKKKIGKVRDTYELPDKMILITTDRQSAFDRVLAAIPFKGQVLNQTSAWWFEKTKHIVPNHVIAIPDPNVTVGKKCTVFPVEFVVRGYITGTTSTSAWVNYQNGMREYCGNTLPDGLKKNQKLDHPLVTPTTKSDEHDRLISPAEIVSEGLMAQTDWDYVSSKALELFIFGQTIAAEHDLILVDTKYEFGKDANGQITLIDEIHTPDSSRYWLAGSYAERFAAGQEPENIDKEFLRLWFTKNCDPYNDKKLPAAPDELVIELSRRYIQLYEMITGEKFVFPEENMAIEERIKNNLHSYL